TRSCHRSHNLSSHSRMQRKFRPASRLHPSLVTAASRQNLHDVQRAVRWREHSPLCDINNDDIVGFRTSTERRRTRPPPRRSQRLSVDAAAYTRHPLPPERPSPPPARPPRDRHAFGGGGGGGAPRRPFTPGGGFGGGGGAPRPPFRPAPPPPELLHTV